MARSSSDLDSSQQLICFCSSTIFCSHKSGNFLTDGNIDVGLHREGRKTNLAGIQGQKSKRIFPVLVWFWVFLVCFFEGFFGLFYCLFFHGSAKVLHPYLWICSFTLVRELQPLKVMGPN